MPPIEEPVVPAAQFIHELCQTAIPANALHMARRCLVDTLAIWAAGVKSTPGNIAYNHAARRYPGSISLPFDGRRVNPIGFAFAGAASIDSVDGHDGHQMSKGHASVALVPALLAELGNEPACSLDELLTHLVVGEEIAIRSALSLHATVSDYHSSGAWNALGCAAIAARIRGLSVSETRHALGIAEYYGPRAQMMRCIDHPSMVKDSSCWGALVGISSADLAEDGFTGAPAITCEAPEVSQIWHDLGQFWRIRESNFKAYPVCRWAHPAVEATLTLTGSQDVDISEIQSILVTTFHEATRLQTRRPENGDEAQYSLPLAVSLALQHNNILPEHLCTDVFDNSETWDLVDKVCFAECDTYNEAFPIERCGDVTIIFKNGEKLRSNMAVARGNHDAPLTDDEIIWKLEHYSRSTIATQDCQKIATVLSDPDNAPTPFELISMLNSKPNS